MMELQQLFRKLLENIGFTGNEIFGRWTELEKAYSR